MMNWHKRIEEFADISLKDIPTNKMCVTLSPSPSHTPSRVIHSPQGALPCSFLLIMKRIRRMTDQQTAYYNSKVTNPREAWKKWAGFAQWIANRLIPGLNNHIRRTADLLPLPHYPLTMPLTLLKKRGCEQERRLRSPASRCIRRRSPPVLHPPEPIWPYDICIGYKCMPTRTNDRHSPKQCLARCWTRDPLP